MPEHTAWTIANDAVAALAAGTSGEAGIVLIAGTGSIAYGYDPETGEAVRAGGWGYLLGDEGAALISAGRGWRRCCGIMTGGASRRC
ncbi:hypothetical protein LJK87_20105 [Paenibacillus sp. P25]|nr:hypothetical protein LJK87_20105 [Paenibacillus sp. P25]